MAVVAVIVTVSANAGAGVVEVVFPIEADCVEKAVITAVALGDAVAVFVFVSATVGKEEIGNHTIFGERLADTGVAHFAATDANVSASTINSITHTAAHIEGKTTRKVQRKKRHDQNRYYKPRTLTE